MNFLRTEAFPNNINPIYEQDPGILSIPQTITKEGKSLLLEELKNINLELAQEHTDNVRQQISTLNRDVSGLTGLLREFSDEYQELYAKMLPGIRPFNELQLSHYFTGSLGITPHVDYAQDRNLNTIFVVQGSSNFYTCSNRSGDNSKRLQSGSGDVLLMRAPRYKGEENRPWHYVQPTTERYVIIARTTAK